MSFEAPKAIDQLLPANYIFHNAREIFVAPEAENIKLPDGYVFGADREYPLAPRGQKISETAFEPLENSFVDGFKPHQALGEVDPVTALMTGIRLYRKGYRMSQGALVGYESGSRSVTDVLTTDFDAPITNIEKLLTEGAVVAPYILMDTPDQKPFYGMGVGLWVKQK